jgi:hypothetical protein
MTLQELEDARDRLISGQHVVTFRSANGKSVTYNMGDLPRLEAMIRNKKRELDGARSRSRKMISSKGL